MSKLSDAQLRWLIELRFGRDPGNRLRGRSQHGGATQTHSSLKRTGLIDQTGLTDAGRAAIKKESEYRLFHNCDYRDEAVQLIKEKSQ